MHSAAHVAPLGRIDDYYDVNVRGTDNVLAACEIDGVRKPRVHVVRRRRHRSRRSQRRQRDAAPARTRAVAVSRDEGAGRTPRARRERTDVRDGRAAPASALGPRRTAPAAAPRRARAKRPAAPVRRARQEDRQLLRRQRGRRASRRARSPRTRRRDRRQGVLHHAGRAGVGRRIRQQPAARGGLSGRDAPPFRRCRAHARLDRVAAPRVHRRRAAA